VALKHRKPLQHTIARCICAGDHGRAWSPFEETLFEALSARILRQRHKIALVAFLSPQWPPALFVFHGAGLHAG
jgi:hypothetical protein